MNKLLRANFRRLWKSKIFWLGMLFTTGIGLFSSITQYREMMTTPGYHPHIDNILFSNCMFMPVVAAVFIGLFTGTEYSDGTIRNKLVVGQSRYAVYFANFIVCMAAVFLMHLINIAVIVTVGFPLVGNLELPVSILIFLGLLSLVTLAALSAIFLLMGMLIDSKANNTAAVIILSTVFLVAATFIDSRIKEPEYYESYTITHTDDSKEQRMEFGEKEKNPNYLQGTRREVYEFLYDFLPGCQMLQIVQQSPEHPVRLSLYSLSIVVVTTACGVFFFRRKNIK